MSGTISAGSCFPGCCGCCPPDCCSVCGNLNATLDACCPGLGVSLIKQGNGCSWMGSAEIDTRICCVFQVSLTLTCSAGVWTLTGSCSQTPAPLCICDISSSGSFSATGTPMSCDPFDISFNVTLNCCCGSSVSTNIVITQQ